MQQASEVVSALADFSRGDPQIILADVNSAPPQGSGYGGSATNVFEYFQACGYRCVYRSVSKSLKQGTGSAAFPRYTTWAGWASGDFQGVCDHIFVSGDIHVAAVLDVPSEEKLAMAYWERLPNEDYPSDHMSLVADLVIP